jgi:hypothetical protein
MRESRGEKFFSAFYICILAVCRGWCIIGVSKSLAYAKVSYEADHSQTKATHSAASVAILKKQMPELAQRYRVKSPGVSGTYVRNEQSRLSDLDILVDFTQTPNLFEFMDLEEHWARALNVKVDLVSRHALKGEIGKRILSKVVTI